MKTYVTFGQTHVHSVNGKTFDHDCVAVIEAPDAKAGRAAAFEYFDKWFFTTYTEDAWDEAKQLPFYPRGYIHVEGNGGSPRFQKTYCSQCGNEFGPGDHGFSHCDDHRRLQGKPKGARPVAVFRLGDWNRATRQYDRFESWQGTFHGLDPEDDAVALVENEDGVIDRVRRDRLCFLDGGA